MATPTDYSVTTLAQYSGHDFGASAPVTLDQQRIDAFADCTEDRQWIHVDTDRAARESPFGGTIAHGMLTLSLIAGKHMELGIYPPDARQVINYGMEQVRFLAPVPAGATVRVHVRIKSVEAKGDSRFVVRTENEVRIDGVEKPALIAELIAYVMA